MDAQGRAGEWTTTLHVVVIVFVKTPPLPAGKQMTPPHVVVVAILKISLLPFGLGERRKEDAVVGSNEHMRWLMHRLVVVAIPPPPLGLGIEECCMAQQTTPLPIIIVVVAERGGGSQGVSDAVIAHHC